MWNRLPRYLCLILAALLLGACTGDDAIKAHVRLLNASPDYSSLDLYADDERRIEGVGYENASGYAKLDADSYTIELKRNGVSSALQSFSESLSEESHQTYVAFGTTGHFTTLKIEEDEGDADSDEAKVLLLNAAEAGELDVYLTEESVDLADASPIFSDIASGSSSSHEVIDSGTYRLRVTAAGDKDDVRFDRSNVTLNSKQVVSLILSATQGGTLVNVLWLPQQGDMVRFANANARVRGAVGVSSGNVTADVSDVNLLTGATAGVISTTYQQVPAGTAAVDLSVSGTAISVDALALTAGGDYTLLIWDSGSTTQTTLISDDNRLPSEDDKAKIRLINGLSGSGASATLSVDYGPVAENVALGQASSYSEVDEGTDYALDVTDASTSDSLHSRTSVTLDAQGVYTMFVAGGSGGSATVTGTLRKDR